MRVPDAYSSSKGRGTFFHLNSAAVNSLRWNLPVDDAFRTVESTVVHPVMGWVFALSTAVYDSSKEPPM